MLLNSVGEPLFTQPTMPSSATARWLTSETAATRPTDNRMRLSEVIGALSYALDLTEGQPPGHSLRCAWIGMQVGNTLGLDARPTVRSVLHTCC